MRKELITYSHPKSPISEIFRTLRTNIQFMSSNKELKTLLITSTQPDEGKSWITANLAITFAQTGKKVIIVDADMRKGRQFKIFKTALKPGLSNYLSGIGANDEKSNDKNVKNYIQNTEIENLELLTSGNIPPNPSELLVSETMVELLNNLKKLADIVIIDGTPSELVTDSIILSRLVDATLIVASHKETKKESLKKVIRNIQNVDGNLIGIILNKIPVNAKKYAEKYYYREKVVSDNKRKKVLDKINSMYSEVKKKNEKVSNLIKENNEKIQKNIKNKTERKSEKIEKNKVSNEIAEEITKKETKPKKTTTKKTASKETGKKEVKKTTKKATAKKPVKKAATTKTKKVITENENIENALNVKKKKVSSDVKKSILDEVKEYNENK